MKIWEQGYQDGTLRSALPPRSAQSHIFTDVKPAFEHWTRALKQLFIFSSASVQAQQLLFRHTEVGDLTGFLNGYFDTETGSKKEADSYRKIAQTIDVSPARILFISDVIMELKAADHLRVCKRSFALDLAITHRTSVGFEVEMSFDLV